MEKLFRLSLILIFSILLISCTTARNRDSEDNLYSVLQFKDAQTENQFDDIYRSGNIYLDYTTVLAVDAIYKDLDYRKRYLDELTDVYYFDQTAQQDWKETTLEEYRNTYEFLVFVYNGTIKKTRLEHASSEWQIFLQDEDGDILKPVSIKKLSLKNREMIYLDKYFYALDRWSEVFRVRFPKLHKQQPSSQDPFELIFSGIKGKTILKWNEPDVFYQSDKYLDF